MLEFWKPLAVHARRLPLLHFGGHVLDVGPLKFEPVKGWHTMRVRCVDQDLRPWYSRPPDDDSRIYVRAKPHDVDWPIYIHLASGIVYRTEEVLSGCVLRDFDKDGLLLGIEILGPIDHLQLQQALAVA